MRIRTILTDNGKEFTDRLFVRTRRDGRSRVRYALHRARDRRRGAASGWRRMGAILHRLGFTRLSARPRHSQSSPEALTCPFSQGHS